MTFNSGPMVNGYGSGQGRLMRDEPATRSPDLVAEAVAALRAFHVDDRRTAKMLLMMWKRRIQLDADQVETILAMYPVVELDLSEPMIYRRSGPGGGINS